MRAHHLQSLWAAKGLGFITVAPTCAGLYDRVLLAVGGIPLDLPANHEGVEEDHKRLGGYSN